jgi:hypothetical protein
VAHHGTAAEITLPMGRVTASELLKVLRALEAARSIQPTNCFTTRRGGSSSRTSG